METKLYPDSPVPNSLEVGCEFQDFAAHHILKQKGIALQVYGSRRYQFDEGESAQGVEFKLDQGFTKYNHLSIEIAEKTYKEQASWIPSGIYRSDNTWLYVQGNYEYFYLFLKKQLIYLHQKGKLDKARDMPTIRRAYLSLDLADIIGEKILPGSTGEG